MPPGTLRSRSFTRFTMRVGLPHLGQSVLLDVSIIFLRSAVLATLAIVSLPGNSTLHAVFGRNLNSTRLSESGHRGIGFSEQQNLTTIRSSDLPILLVTFSVILTLYLLFRKGGA